MHTNRNKRNGFDLSAWGLLFKRCFIMKLMEVFTAPTSPFRRLSASLSENTYTQMNGHQAQNNKERRIILPKISHRTIAE
jgi:hypothetical protein